MNRGTVTFNPPLVGETVIKKRTIERQGRYLWHYFFSKAAQMGPVIDRIPLMSILFAATWPFIQFRTLKWAREINYPDLAASEAEWANGFWGRLGRGLVFVRKKSAALALVLLFQTQTYSRAQESQSREALNELLDSSENSLRSSCPDSLRK